MRASPRALRALRLFSTPRVVRPMKTGVGGVDIEGLTGEHEGITKIVLNRPRANALSRRFVEQLREAVQHATFDASMRAVIICSAVDGVFCAGADLKERAAMPEHEVAPFVATLRSLMLDISKIPKPTIAVAEGAAFGGGLEMMLACDLRIAGSKAVMGLTETSLGIIPGAGGTQRLPRLIGVARAKEMIFTAERVTADRAVEIGLVNYAVPAGKALDKALELGAKVAANGPAALVWAKEAVDRGGQCDLYGGLAVEGICYNRVIATSDRREGLKAFQEKRKPAFTGH